MDYESEWDGFTTLATSGVAEALYVAGVDCGVHERCEEAGISVRTGTAGD